jgi:regulator of replication initiation timing
MPRPRVVKKGAFLTAWLEEEYLTLLDRIARAEGISRSELLRRIIVEWLESPEVKAKYGLQMVFAEQVAKASTVKLAPLTRKRLRDVEEALKEVEPVINKLEKKLPSLVEEAKRLMAEKRQVEEWLTATRWVKVGNEWRRERVTHVEIGGRKVDVVEYYREWRARTEGMFKLLEGALDEWESARRRFFRVVYYPWLKYLRREVPVDVMLAYEDRIAVLLEKINRAEPFARELERTLRPLKREREGSR